VASWDGGWVRAYKVRAMAGGCEHTKREKAQKDTECIKGIYKERKTAVTGFLIKWKRPQ
jgi:hypothetical protein